MNLITNALIQSLVIGIGIAVTYWLLSKVKSLKIQPPVKEEDITPEQREKFQTYGVAEGFVFVVLTALATYLLKFPLGRVFDYFISKPEYEKLIAMPIEAVILVALGVSAALLMRFSTNLMTPFYKKEDIIVYRYLGTKQMGFDSYKLMLPASNWTLIIAILFFAKCIHTTSYLTSDSIIMNRFLSLETKKYLISDLIEFTVAKKQKAPNGNIVSRPEFVMKFKDGFVWVLDEENDPQTTDFVRALLRKSSVAIDEVDFFEH